VQNSAKTEHDIVVEIDRYIVIPGQAAGLQGEKFDLHAFHDTVPGNGALPLDLLETQVRAFIEKTRR